MKQTSGHQCIYRGILRVPQELAAQSTAGYELCDEPWEYVTRNTTTALRTHRYALEQYNRGWSLVPLGLLLWLTADADLFHGYVVVSARTRLSMTAAKNGEMGSRLCAHGVFPGPNPALDLVAPLDLIAVADCAAERPCLVFKRGSFYKYCNLSFPWRPVESLH